MKSALAEGALMIGLLARLSLFERVSEVRYQYRSGNGAHPSRGEYGAGRRGSLAS